MLVVKTAQESGDGGFHLGHFGLGLKYYTHFTSPIRRFADVIVHRQLLGIILRPCWKLKLQESFELINAQVNKSSLQVKGEVLMSC